MLIAAFIGKEYTLVSQTEDSLDKLIPVYIFFKKNIASAPPFFFFCFHHDVLSKHRCLTVLQTYFIDGGKDAALKKDARRRFYFAINRAQENNQQDPKIRPHSKVSNMCLLHDPPSKAPKYTDQPLADNNESTIQVELSHLQVLDVGSSFNPFKKHGLNVDAIDISPANEGLEQIQYSFFS